MPITLPDHVRHRLTTAAEDGHPVVAATVDADGQPRFTFYGTAHVHSDDQLALWVHNPKAGIVERLNGSRRMTLMYYNLHEHLVWQFEGRATLVEDEATRRRIFANISASEQANDPQQRGHAVLVDLDQVRGRGIEMAR